VWRQLAGELQNIRQLQLNFDQNWEGHDAKVNIDDWSESESDLKDGSDMLTGSDASDGPDGADGSDG
jgi:hypothetical protein